MDIDILGIDLAKRVFQLHGADHRGHALHGSKVMRAVHRVRELLVHQRTALINQVRGLLAERGVVMAQTPTAFKRALPSILEKCEGERSHR